VELLLPDHLLATQSDDPRLAELHPDVLINCIDGWLTTHCDCTQAFVAPKPKFPVVAPVGGVMGM
jgi:hypothetical protein